MISLSSVILLVGIVCAAPAPEDSTKRAVDVVNEFGLQLVQSLQQNDDQNVVFSPIGVHKSLLMVLKNSEGDTEKELRHALYLDEKDDAGSVEMTFDKLLMDVLDKEEEDLELRMLTRMLINRKGATSLKETFKRAVKDELKQEIKEVDFTADPKALIQDVNDWITKGTNQKIPRFFRDNLDPKNSVVLLSASSFAGKPKTPFKEMKEKKSFQNFITYNQPLVRQEVPYIQSSGEFRAKTGVPELRSDLLEIPFKRNDISLIIVQPKNVEDLQFLNENITSGQLSSAFKELMEIQPKQMKVVLPKLKLEFDLEMKDFLEEFDVKTLFTSAQFKPAFRSEAEEQKLSMAIHKAVFEIITEKGAESDDGADTENVAFIDRPFMFALRDNKSGANLILGKVNHLVDEEALGLGFI